MTTLRGRKIGDNQLREFLTSHRVTTLSLIRTSITEAGFHLLAEISTLQELEIVEGAVSDDAVSKLLRGRFLRSLLLRQCRKVGDAALSRGLSSELRELYLDGSGITSAGLSYVEAAANLQTLLLDNTAVDDGGVGSLHPLRNMQTLSLKNCPLSGAGIADLQPRGLLQVFLNGTTMDDNVAELLASRSPPLKVLDASHTRITDEGVCRLSELETLNDLRLCGNDITDAALDTLRTNPNLQALHLHGTRVTETGINRLKVSNRKMRIYWDPEKFDDQIVTRDRT